jgi:hypothetical protein
MAVMGTMPSFFVALRSRNVSSASGGDGSWLVEELVLDRPKTPDLAKLQTPNTAERESTIMIHSQLNLDIDMLLLVTDRAAQNYGRSREQP